MNILTVVFGLLFFSTLAKIVFEYSSFMHQNVICLYKNGQKYYIAEGLIYYAIAALKNNKVNNLPITFFGDFFLAEENHKVKVVAEELDKQEDKHLVKVFVQLQLASEKVLAASCVLEMKDQDIIIKSWQVLP